MKAQATATNGAEAAVELPPRWDQRSGKKAAKELRRHAEDQDRLIDGWEQYRALWDGIDFKRQLINMGDKKVRLALVIMGAVNAGILIVITRGRVLDSIPEGLRVWLASLVAIYALVSFVMVAHCVEALRPRPEAKITDREEWRVREESSEFVAGEARPGLMIRGPDLKLSYEEERRLWRSATLTDVNGELILFNRSSSVILMGQLTCLHKVYLELKLLVLLAAVILAILLGGTILSAGPTP